MCLKNHLTFYPLFDVSQNSFSIIHVIWCVLEIIWQSIRYFMCFRNQWAFYQLFFSYVSWKSRNILPVIYMSRKSRNILPVVLWVSEITGHCICYFMCLNNHGAFYPLFYVSRLSLGVVPIILCVSEIMGHCTCYFMCLGNHEAFYPSFYKS